MGVLGRYVPTTTYVHRSSKEDVSDMVLLSFQVNVKSSKVAEYMKERFAALNIAENDKELIDAMECEECEEADEITEELIVEKELCKLSFNVLSCTFLGSIISIQAQFSAL